MGKVYFVDSNFRIKEGFVTLVMSEHCLINCDGYEYIVSHEMIDKDDLVLKKKCLAIIEKYKLNLQNSYKGKL